MPLAIYKYLILFPLAIIEGPILMVASGFFLKLGYFEFWPLYLILMAGDLTGDVVWYGVGYFGGYGFIKKFGRFFSITEELITLIGDFFHRHQSKILLISKITMGFGFALVTLITAGIVKIPFKKYFFFNAAGQLVWTGFLLSLGYFFGNVFLQLNRIFGLISAFAFFILVLTTLYGLSRYFRKKMLRGQKSRS